MAATGDPAPRSGRRRFPRSATVALALVLVATPLVVMVSCGQAGQPSRAVGEAPGSESIREVDGGSRYYARFPRSLPSDPSYFPIGVWFESVLSEEDIDADKQAGLNLYVALTGNSDLSLIERSGMKVIAQHGDWAARSAGPGSEAIAGWLLADEIDMQMDPRDGFAKLRSLSAELPADDGRLRYANYGKGVTFWNTDGDAARYVNEFQDVVSADNYWFTDRDLCDPSQGGGLLRNGDEPLTPHQCHRAANYGRTVDRVRRLLKPSGSRPVWAFVEVGHPSSDSSWPSIEPAEVTAAVWSSIIHGARGIVYFNHSFGGPAQTQHALREHAYADVRSAVTATNRRIENLAPVLNAPFVDTFASTTAAVDTMTKSYGGRFYLFAASRATRAQRVAFQLPCAGETRISVLDEDRDLRLASGSFEDDFTDANAVHIYRIDGSGCWLPAGRPADSAPGPSSEG